MIGMKLPKEQRDQIIEQIQHFFEMERSETIGTLAAGEMLDFMIKEIGPHLYNHAINDARATVLERMQTLEDELYALEKPILKNR